MLRANSTGTHSFSLAFLRREEKKGAHSMTNDAPSSRLKGCKHATARSYVHWVRIIGEARRIHGFCVLGVECGVCWCVLTCEVWNVGFLIACVRWVMRVVM
jgi:hypothetical protein